MKKCLIIILSFLILSFISTPSHAFWWMGYHKPAFHGRVINAETKEPIEGAVVVAVYKEYPVISGPGGGGQSIMDIKEILTNIKGEFYFPSYTTVIQPFSIEGSVTFIIFKPGYGSFPDGRINPPKLMMSHVPPGNSNYGSWDLSFEEFFSDEAGTVKEFWGREPLKMGENPPQKINLAMGVVELPKLKTREERKKIIPYVFPNADEFLEKQKNLIRLINEEEENLGLQKSDLFKAREFIFKGGRN